MDQAARVQRLKVPAPPGSLEPVRQQLSRWLEAQTPARLGLPANAIVLLRSVRAPWSALRPDSPADVLGQRLRHAVRPAMGGAPGAGCDAVWFTDEAELLACLAHDCLRGQIAQQWWWQTWLGHRPVAEEALHAWLKSARVAPAAMARLNAMGQGLAWARHIGPAGRQALLQAMQRHHPVAHATTTWLRQALSDAPPMGAPLADEAGVAPDATQGARSAADADHRRGASPPASEPPSWSICDGASVMLALCTLLNESPHLALDERVLFARLQPDVRTDDAAHAEPVSQDACPSEGPGPAKGGHRPATAAWSWATGHRLTGHASTPSQALSDQERAHDQRPAGSATEHTPATSSGIPTHSDALAVDPHATAASPPHAERSARPNHPGTPTPWARPQVTQTSHGGVFFLLNVALAWELYGDFTRPQHALLSVSPWQFLHAAATALLGRSFATDPLAIWLRDQAPFTRPRPASTLGQAPEQLIPPAEAHWLMAADTSPRHWPTKRPHNELSCWWPLLRQRLSLALSLPAPEAIATCLNLSARIERRGERLDVCFALQHLPLAVRLAGLDRNPGWVPASGCDLRFHFEA